MQSISIEKITERADRMDLLYDKGNRINYLKAIEKRVSRRAYLNQKIEADKLERIREAIRHYNKLSGLSIQLIEDGSQAFNGLRKSYGMFYGVRTLIALVGKTADPHIKEKAGYFGELLILEATALGLGTCFVGASYDKKNCPCQIGADESLICVITMGPVNEKPGLREKAIYHMTHRKSIKLEELYEADMEVPSWFMKGVKATQLAPSAINRHPVRFVYKKGEVYAYVKDTSDFNLVDLGIAKANFEIGAEGKFEYGNYGRFVKTIKN